MNTPRNSFLPTSAEEMRERGWDQVDFAYVCGDAYVDHPSFGAAIITRMLEANGYKVGVISQPDWKNPESIAVFGQPRLGFMVSAGNMDSLVNHYTVARKHRSSDAYSPGGKMGLRPDRATIVYCGLIRQTFKDAPIIIGGIEASLRRLAHYDYWSDSLRRSILLDSGADLLCYGMGERSVVEVADALASGLDISDITFIDGTVYRTRNLDAVYDYELLPSWDEIGANKRTFAQSFLAQYRASDPFTGKRLVESYSAHMHVVQNPPAKPLSTEEMDAVYALPYARAWHPRYNAEGGIPGFSEVKFSLTSSRGCFGECAFCALTFHQGRIVQARSHASLLEEAQDIIDDPDFKGYIHDVGGPTANFRAPACRKQMQRGACTDKRCLTPTVCKACKPTHADYLKLLRKLRALPGVKKVFVRSGIRFDYLMADPNHQEFMDELVKYHVSGQLKVAPEHISDAVLAYMGKPRNFIYQRFCKEYEQANERAGMKQFLVPYLMSSHPGSGLDEAIQLAEYVRDMGYNPEQVQDFYPTPGSLATCMYYTGIDPLTMEPVYVPTSSHEKALQRALIQYRNPKNYDLVVEALTKAGRLDLIGFDKKCLAKPRNMSGRTADEGRRGKASGKAVGKLAGAGGRNDNGAGGGRGGRGGHGGKRGKGGGWSDASGRGDCGGRGGRGSAAGKPTGKRGKGGGTPRSGKPGSRPTSGQGAGKGTGARGKASGTFVRDKEHGNASSGKRYGDRSARKAQGGKRTVR